MAQNYTRQSSMADGDTITAALFNNEYNQLVNAFAYSSSSASSTGHRHDGSAGQGGNIPQIGDLDFLNKVVVDGTNNRVGFFVEVSSSAVEQVRIQDGAIVPVTDNDIDLGTSSLEFKDGYFDGTVYADAINFNGTAITATAAELNIMDGVTSTAAEINLLDGVTATTTELNYVDTGASVGTVVASKVVTVDANKDVSSFRNITLTGELDAGSLDISGDVDIDGTLETDALSINGTTVTATAAELNILDGVTSTAAELNLLDGVTSTTAELNILDGVTSTAAELNILDGKAFLDEDDMSSNSATGIASQQSIKAYVDAQITAEDLDFQADSGGALSIDLDSETLTFTGGTGIDTSGSGNTVTFAIDSTVATLTGSQTLTNKSLTAPTLTGTAVVASLDISGDIDVDGTTNLDVVDIDGAVDMASTLTVAGEVFIAEKLSHTGDTDTHFKFAGANDIRIVAGGVDHVAFDGTIVFNQSAADMDLRVESTGNQNMLFIDSGNDVVNIGGTTSQTGDVLSIHGSGTNTVARMYNTNAGADGSIFIFQKDSSSPADNDVLGDIRFHGNDDGSTMTQYAQIKGTSLDVTNGTEDGQLVFNAILNGTNRERLKINATEAVFNEEGQDLDFRVESNGNANMLFVDAGNDRIQIANLLLGEISSNVDIIQSTSSSGLLVDVTGDIILDADNSDIILKDNGTTFGQFTNDSGNLIIYNSGSQMLKGLSGGSNAEFVGSVTAAGLTVNGTALVNDDLSVQGAAPTFQLYDTSVTNNITKFEYDETFLIDIDKNNARGSTALQIKMDGTEAFSINSSRNATFSGSVTVGTSTAGMVAAGSSNSFQIQKSGTHGYINQSDSGDLIVRMGSSFEERMRIRSDGNAGLGSAGMEAFSAYRQLSIGAMGNLMGTASAGTDGSFHISQNTFLDTGGDWKAIHTDEASNYYQYQGGHYFRVAASTSANSNISWVNAFEIGPSGGIVVNSSQNNNINFVVKSGATANALVVDGQSGNVAIGTSTVLDGLNIYASSATNLRLHNGTTGASTSAGGIIQQAGDEMYVWNYEPSNLIFGTTNAERIRIDSSGNVLVGKSATTQTTAGTVLYNNGQIYATANEAQAQVLTRTSTDGKIQIFYKDSAEVGTVVSRSGVSTSFVFDPRTNGSGLSGGTKQIQPANENGNVVDNSIDIGSGTTRFQDIYATNGTIQTSDRNEKQDIEALSDSEQRVAVAAKGLLRKFRWKSAVEEKGDDARIHFGIIAQDLQDAFTAEGLDAGRYAMFISSTWTDEETGEERTRLGVRYSELLAFIISAI